MMPIFMFATGIENSYPTIDQGRVKVDEMEKCGHYKYWCRSWGSVFYAIMTLLWMVKFLQLSVVDKLAKLLTEPCVGGLPIVDDKNRR